MGSIGWYGIPGGPSSRSTKTHLVRNGKPACGAKLSAQQAFQWCSHEGGYVPECEHCKRILSDEALREAHKLGKKERSKRYPEGLVKLTKRQRRILETGK